MTSPTNTAGLEVVATVVSAHGDPESFGERTIDVVANLSRIPYSMDFVTAASAQAMNDLVAMGLARDAAEARADRLAILGKRLSERLCEALERAYVTDAEWVKTEYPNGVTEIYVIEAALKGAP